ncbi:lipopolysaccharide biosynthesis protein [bacterium]|nr:lipopolysaccharide biosynthesis protein [bacterium]
MFMTGKNTKPPYYLRNMLRWCLPRGITRRRLAGTLASLADRPDRELIERRVDYCNKLDALTPLAAAAPQIGDLRLGRRLTVYFFDCYEYLRWFDPGLHWDYLFGDITHVPAHPTIVKSRPIHGDNRNSVLLNLDKVRHFIFLDDRLSFAEKRDQAIFRGSISQKPERRRFLEMFHGHPLCDARSVKDGPDVPAAWRGGPLTLYDHLRYKFIVSLEGNDVASNLKWAMSSNSVAVMPRPTYETWFMEGTLVPEEHYIEIRPDYADLEEKLRHYIAHPGEAERISAHAHAYVAQFFDPRRELLTSLFVLQKYFRLTGQLED